MNPTSSEITGQLCPGNAASNLIGTPHGETGSAGPTATGSQPAIRTPWREHLKSSANVSTAVKVAKSMFGKTKPELSAEQLSSLRQLADEVTCGEAPDPAGALMLAKTLSGCFRSKDLADPKVFASALAAVFQNYPEAAGLMVIDPMHGLPSTAKFPPAIAEVRQAMDDRQEWARCLRMTIDRKSQRKDEADGYVSQV